MRLTFVVLQPPIRVVALAPQRCTNTGTPTVLAARLNSLAVSLSSSLHIVVHSWHRVQAEGTKTKQIQQKLEQRKAKDGIKTKIVSGGIYEICWRNATINSYLLNFGVKF